MKNKKVILTGSDGFIGNKLKIYLTNKGFDVYEISRKNGYDLSLRNWTDKIPKESYYCVIHLAQSQFYKSFPDGANDMMFVNVDATYELLEWGRKHQIKNFVFASTGNVYKLKNTDYREEDKLEPNSFYGATKLCAESIVTQYKIFYPVQILRLFGVYGPGQKSILF